MNDGHFPATARLTEPADHASVNVNFLLLFCHRAGSSAARAVHTVA